MDDRRTFLILFGPSFIRKTFDAYIQSGTWADEEVRAGLREFIDYLKDLFERKRRAPTDDMISHLVHVEEDEILATVFLMFLAGRVTTVNLLGNGGVALLTHPDQLAKFQANPELLAKGVVEETLRYWGPVDFIGRRTTRGRGC